MISADITDNIEKKCMSLGANSYISKPLNIYEFVDKLNEFI